MKVFSKTNCPQCDQVRAVLTTAGLEFEVVKVDEDADAMAFMRSEGHRSVPQVYDGEKLIGGLKEVRAYCSNTGN